MLKKDSLIVVLGPTASGKTALAVALAKALDGEVISADSMQIYCGMDIGTAKPTAEEMQGIPHHLISILKPGERFSVAEYAVLAKEKINDVLQRGKVPILAGGTGLYIQSVVDNIRYDEEAVHDDALREKLRGIAAEQGNLALWNRLRELDPETAAALHPNNLGRVIRAIEVAETTGRTISEQVRESRREQSPYHACQIGLRYADRAILYERIDRRVDLMLQEGLLEEARTLHTAGLCGTSGQAIGYKELAAYFEGNCTLEEAVEHLKRETRRYAKRQLTWFGRDERIRWIEPDMLSEGKTVFFEAVNVIQTECGVME